MIVEGNLKEITLSLKKRLDNIQIKMAQEGASLYGESWAWKQKLMWLSGLEILKDYPELENDKLAVGGRGVTTGFRQVARKIERDRGTIKRWIDCVKEIGKTQKDFDKYVNENKPKAIEKWLNGQNPRLINQKIPQLLPHQYEVICADPPWDYPSALGRKRIGYKESEYSTMDLEYLCEMGKEIKKISAENCTLFLWATVGRLEWAFPVIEAWGFKYKSSWVWDKIKYNMGYYGSIRHEYLIIAGKGKSTPSTDYKTINSIDSVISIEKSKKHSEKPDKIYEIIDLLYPNKKKIELFARKQRKGWDVWGNEV